MNGEQLKQFRNMVNLSQDAFARHFGYSRRQVQLMEADKQAVRRSLALACAAYALGIREYDGPAAAASWRKRMENKD